MANKRLRQREQEFFYTLNDTGTAWIVYDNPS